MWFRERMNYLVLTLMLAKVVSTYLKQGKNREKLSRKHTTAQACDVFISSINRTVWRHFELMNENSLNFSKAPH